MVTLTEIRSLDLCFSPAPGRARHLSAASGLVRVGAFLYVVADDEHHLGVFEAEGREPGRLIRLLPGDLPDAHDARKAAKPDFEALALLPRAEYLPFGALFAFASGSKPNRQTGILLPFDAAGALEPPQSIDLSGLYALLREQLGKLNIEAAVMAGDRMVMLQRGNKKNAVNACISFRWAAFIDAPRGGVLTGAALDLRVDLHELGQVNDIPLSFSDVTALPNGDLLFAAIAEDTDDSYVDGACAGAALGILQQGGQLSHIWQLERPWKIEGVDARVEGSSVHLTLVTDADDAGVAAVMLYARLDGYPFGNAFDQRGK